MSNRVRRWRFPLVALFALALISTLSVRAILQPQAAHRQAVVTPTIPPRPVDLHVVGDHLVDKVSGQRVTLHGVNRDGSDFLCADGSSIFDGPTDMSSITALARWTLNAVRLPLNEQCWLQQPRYQRAIAAYTQLLTDHGFYVIVDLHKNSVTAQIDTHAFQPMADTASSPSFWSQVATQFKSNGRVLFDLFNEPHGISWACWRDGGDCDGAPYAVAGMQTLVNSVRSTGATNVILVAGLGWAGDFQGWPKYHPRDPLNNIAISWHLYTESQGCADTACFAGRAAPLAGVPVVMTEFGTDNFGRYCGVGGVDQLLAWLDKVGAGYLAWSWNVGAQTCGSLALISDWHGTPKAPNGVLYYQHLRAIS